MNPLTFIREVGDELKAVTWPSRKQTIQMTVVVLVVSAVIGVYITTLDAFLLRITEFLLK